MKTQSIQYLAGKTPCIGYLAYEEFIPFKRPVVVIAHPWDGLNDFIKEKAHEIAKLGYIAFAADVYGNGKTASDDEAGALMMPLFLDRALLRERIVAAATQARALPQADGERVGAMGFCFGGLTVIELLRSGFPLRGVVSFHGVLGDQMGEKKARLAPNAAHISGALLVLHGIKDPLVPLEDLIRLQNEMTQAGVDWQVHIFGSAGHSFTNPDACDAPGGRFFEPLANQRSFNQMQNFFREKLL